LIDVYTIEPGVDFAEEIFRAVAACQVRWQSSAWADCPWPTSGAAAA
jgi:hypothetical protein